MQFLDRRDAGRQLARTLTHLRARPHLIVLGLPRGGVPVAFEVARALDAPLDVLVVRKLGAPGMPEFAMGALASPGVRVLNRSVIVELGIDADTVKRVSAAQQQELQRRERQYRGQRPPLSLAGQTVILVDDGLATGATMRAAVKAVRQRQPAQLLVAVPVAATDSARVLAREADVFVCLTTPEPFYGVGRWYRDFSQTDDEQVRTLLATDQRGQTRAAPAKRANRDTADRR